MSSKFAFSSPSLHIWLVLFIVTALGCASTTPEKNLRPGKTYTKKMEHRIGGFRRSYRFHVPTGYSQKKKWPLVVVLHGAFSTAREMEKETGFSLLADQEGFVVLYPNGMGIFGLLQHWNAGHCCGKAADDDINDVDFVMSGISDLSRLLRINQSRIYLTGFSNGAMLAHLIGTKRSKEIAAIAPLAGSVGSRPSAGEPFLRIPSPESPLPLPVLIFHGLQDQKVPYYGGPRKGREKDRHYVSADESAAFWASSNGCTVSFEKQTLPQTVITHKIWRNCKMKTEVHLVCLKTWDHRWPGRYFTQKLKDNNPLKDFDATAWIWQFFKQYQRQRE